MINKTIRIYLLLSIIASFSPIPKNEMKTENCILTSNHTTYSPITLVKLGCKISEESGKCVLKTLEKCKRCHQIFCSLKPVYNFPLRSPLRNGGIYCSCIELQKVDCCTDNVCKKAKYPFPTPTNIWNKLTSTEGKCAGPSAKGITPKKDVYSTLFPNYQKIVKKTSAKEIWIGIATLAGLLCFLKLTA